MPPTAELFYRFAVALAIGILIGLERQYRKADHTEKHLFGGIRTFPLIALAGCAAAMLANTMGSAWAFVAIAAVVGSLLVVAYAGTVARSGFGMTTEVAAIVTFLIGGICFYGQLELAAALGIVTLGLLSLKIELHRFSGTLSNEDIISLVKFGLMTAIVLPILPGEPLLPAPFDVLTLKNVWLMVVLVAGIGFVGYVLKKLLGSQRAILLTGFLGGLVSSTAVTLTFAERSRARPALARAFAVAIVIAWTTMFIRVIVEVAVVNASLLSQLWIPMTAAGVAGALYCLALRQKSIQQEAQGEDVEVESPFSLKKALTFGGFYALVLVVARVAQMYFGDEGIYASAVAAGLTDVDAITLSMAELSKAGGSVDPEVAVRAITIAAVANTLVKTLIVMATGHALLKKTVLPGFLVILIAALGTAFLL